jgi:hypothetical protein
MAFSSIDQNLDLPGALPSPNVRSGDPIFFPIPDFAGAQPLLFLRTEAEPRSDQVTMQIE